MELPSEFTPYNKIVSLVKQVGEFKERRDIQNVIFILKSQGLHFGEKFSMGQTCPYSFDLQIELDDLVDGNVLSENGTINFNEQYNSKVFSNADHEIEKKKNLIEFLSNISHDELEMISTFLYLRDFDFSLAELKLKLSKLFPDASRDFSDIQRTATDISEHAK